MRQIAIIHLGDGNWHEVEEYITRPGCYIWFDGDFVEVYQSK